MTRSLLVACVLAFSLSGCASTASGLKGLVRAISTGSYTISAVSDQDPTQLATLSVVVN